MTEESKEGSESQNSQILTEKEKGRKRGKLCSFIALIIILVLGGMLVMKFGCRLGPVIITPPPEKETTKVFTLKIPIETSFAFYQPYEVTVTPKVAYYKPRSDLGDVVNISDFRISKAAREALTSNSFVVTPTNYEQIYKIYKDNTEAGRPNFVTTDALLHTFHILYDYTLRNVEIEKFIPDLKKLNQVMVQESLDYYNSLGNRRLKEAARKNVAFFCMASKLLEPDFNVPSLVTSEVEGELSLIESHLGFEYSPIFDYREDYSQYVPRGHYTRNEDFKRYFKAMMWYGRMMMRVRPGSTPEAVEKGKEETRQAIMMALALSESRVDNEPVLVVWERIYQTTVFFVGKTDDLSVYQYLELIKKVYGKSFSLEDLVDEEKLTTFISEAQKLPTPKIVSSFVTDLEKPEEVTLAFRFMGQRFIPDSYMFQQLVYGKVGTQNTPRLFPKGLDIASVLGSKRAFEILEKEGETKYINYEKQMSKLQKEFGILDQAQWAENLYWNWLYSLLPTLGEKGTGYPFFMQTKAWVDKELNTFLGSWTELRHDTILYAKQSYTLKATGVMPKPEKRARGFVEPNPEVFARLAALSRFTREGLGKREVLSEEYKAKLEGIEKLLVALKIMAEKELLNQSLTEEEYERIKGIGKELENLVIFSPMEEEEITSETDKKMAVVADVHTDVNTGQVLEEGVGSPGEIFVVVKIGDNLILTSGGVFSYYEFKQPMSERLTDEAWQGMEKPALPSWTESFVRR
jgi:hypothetical protein